MPSDDIYQLLNKLYGFKPGRRISEIPEAKPGTAGQGSY
jgi:hypothetical protein